jgi:hypothetical protein
MKTPTLRMLGSSEASRREKPNPGYFFVKGTEWGKH